MTSTWKNQYVVSSLEKGLKDRFKDVQEESHILIFLKVMMAPTTNSLFELLPTEYRYLSGQLNGYTYAFFVGLTFMFLSMKPTVLKLIGGVRYRYFYLYLALSPARPAGSHIVQLP